MAFRLIDTSTGKLKPIDSLPIPEYAILSHTWLSGEEVSYQEMADIQLQPDHQAKQKSGYTKILKACEVGQNAGHQYIWIDTCCIDQSSSAEQSEAINSMFRWYQGAKVCFAYLADLPPDCNLDDSMPRCRWFARGWCLQELIAPRDVKFYDSSWQCVGSKLDTPLRRLISRISKIEETVLTNPSLLPTKSVAQKMAWAARRETTKAEDKAYCLLGIFDVNMPLLYGEGQRAFMRLQKEIIKGSNDLSIFAWGHPQTTTPQRRDVASSSRPSGDSRGGDREGGDEESNNSSLPNQTVFGSLFAESPRDFADCGNLVLQTGIVRRNFAFSVTNNGLFLSRMKLRVDFENGCYLLPLLCYDTESPRVRMYLALRKVGPDLFVRLQHCQWETIYRWNQSVDGYVITTVTPETRGFIQNSHIESVQLRSLWCSKETLYNSILEIFPQDIWDASTLAFLQSEDHPFSGHIKFSSRVLRGTLPGSTSLTWDDFYLAWGGLFIPGTANSSESRETLWVRLYWAAEWKGCLDPRDQRFIETGSDGLSGLDKDNIRCASGNIHAIVVTTGDLGKEYFRVDIDVVSR
jgi:hypothetical protein